MLLGRAYHRMKHPKTWVHIHETFTTIIWLGVPYHKCDTELWLKHPNPDNDRTIVVRGFVNTTPMYSKPKNNCIGDMFDNTS